MLRRLRLFRSDQRGTAAVEMALMLPLLILLMFGGLEVAHFLYVEHQVVKGVRDGARYAARMPFGGAVEDTIKNVTRTGLVSGGTPRVDGWQNGQITVVFACNGSSELSGKGIYKTTACPIFVTVSTTVPYRSLFGALTGFAVGINVRASQQAAVMGV